jgi:hypothetical protein
MAGEVASLHPAGSTLPLRWPAVTPCDTCVIDDYFSPIVDRFPAGITANDTVFIVAGTDLLGGL